MILVFDIDDTVVETHSQLSKILTRRGIDVSHGQYLTSENTGGVLPELLDNPVCFMLNSQVADGVVEILEWLTHVRGFEVAFCTHRGYHLDGRKLTEEFLEQEGIDFESLFVLDPAKHPCKIDFLDAVYGKGKYILIDDRPNFSNEYEPQENLILRDRPWNQTVKARRFSSFHDLPNELSYVTDL